MHRSFFAKTVFLGALCFCLAVSLGGTASAEDPNCVGGFSALNGRGEGRGIISLASGTACRMPVRVNGNQTMQSIQIIRAPSHGIAAASSTGFRYQARKGFKGQDSMAIRFTGLSGSKKRTQATANISITVH
jgi:hypothetical protein